MFILIDEYYSQPYVENLAFQRMVVDTERLLDAQRTENKCSVMNKTLITFFL